MDTMDTVRAAGREVTKSFEIPEGYDLFFRSPLVDKISDVQIICLSDVHLTGFGIQGKNARLIDKTIENNPNKKVLVLVESAKSLEIVNQKGHQLVHSCKKELDVKGWDIGRPSEYLYVPPELMDLRKQIEEADEKWHIVSHPLSDPSSLNRDEWKNLLSSSKEAQETRDDLWHEYEEKYGSKAKREEDLIESMTASYPIRNNKMIETLTKVTPIYDIIFVIAGLRHFVPNPNPTKKDLIGNLEVKPLHDFLTEQRAVILNDKMIETALKFRRDIL